METGRPGSLRVVLDRPDPFAFGLDVSSPHPPLHVVPPEGAEVFTVIGSPEGEFAGPTRDQQGVAVGPEGDLLTALRAADQVKASARLRVPDPDPGVPTAGGEPLAVRGERQSVD